MTANALPAGPGTWHARPEYLRSLPESPVQRTVSSCEVLDERATASGVHGLQDYPPDTVPPRWLARAPGSDEVEHRIVEGLGLFPLHAMARIMNDHDLAVRNLLPYLPQHEGRDPQVCIAGNK